MTFGQNSNASCDKTFTENTKSLFICGYITSNKKEIDGVSILLFKNGSEKPMYISPVDLRLSGGNFCHEVLMPLANQHGRYTVEIYYFRKIVASYEFEIR
jgi:hypothetical protein